MRSIQLLALCALLGAAAPALGSHSDPGDHDEHAEHDATQVSEPVAPTGPYQVVIDIHGIVCSFCAMGAHRALIQLEGLDASQFTDGVLIDIENQQVTLAFLPGAALPVSEIREAVRASGYDLVDLRIKLRGREPPE